MTCNNCKHYAGKGVCGFPHRFETCTNFSPCSEKVGRERRIAAIIERAGGHKAISERLKLDRTTPYGWMWRKNGIPEKYMDELEKMIAEREGRCIYCSQKTEECICEDLKDRAFDGSDE